MMRILILLALLIQYNQAFSQGNFLEQYQLADSLLKQEKFGECYKKSKSLAEKLPKTDTLYPYVIWQYMSATSNLEQQHRFREDWKNSLALATEALEIIQIGKKYYNLSAREYWMYKNMVVAYFGLGELEKAKGYQTKLYMAYKDKSLPKGLNEYYNFEFFKWGKYNVWGYEWYPELGDPETQGSYSKIVYYIYSTNEDGTDKSQLYRLHVLKFHKFDNSVKFDYVLTLRQETEAKEMSRTLFGYTYEKPIDYKKLRKDIEEVLNGNYSPNLQPHRK